MAGEWVEESFPEVVDFQEGPGILAKDFREDGVPLVRLAGLERGVSVLSGCNYLDPDAVAKRWSHFALIKGDVLLSTSASLGRIAVVADDGVGAIPYTGIIRMRPRDQRLVPSFIRYLLEGPDFQRQAEMVGAGSVIRHFGPMHLRQMTVTIPPPAEQRAIAHILGTLDDKIELNRRMSETLEAMARALFKSWFVDFDPVRAKAAGRDPGLPRPLADLFPARLVDSALGEIPEGWEVGVLEDALAEIEVGGRPKGGVAAYTHGVPSIGAESIVGLGVFDYSKTKYVPREYFDRMTKGHLKSRDVLLYKDGGRPGEFEPHVTLFGDGFPFTTAAINEHVYRLRAKPHLGQEYLFFWLSSDLVMEEMRIKGTGVAVPGLNSTQVKSLTTLFPPKAVVNAFSRLAEPSIARVLATCNASRTLTALRDALLPTLISGELRVPNAERIVGRVV